jgi:hypothetical protein
MTLRYCYISLLLLTACVPRSEDNKANQTFGQKVAFKPPELAVVSTRAIKALDNEIHGVSFISDDGTVITKDSISALLSQIAQYDISDDSHHDAYSRNCGAVQFLTWMPKTHRNKITRIEKVMVKTRIPLSHGRNNTITVTDFDIYSVNKPHHTAMRIIDDYDLENLIIGNQNIRRIAESIPVGLENAIARMDSLKKACR